MRHDTTRPLAPPIDDYALIGDCRSAALITSAGSIEWCTFPRFDSGSCFGRILDRDRGGFCSIEFRGTTSTARSYLDGTMVLSTTVRTRTGEATILDCFTMPARTGAARDGQLLRIIDCIRGRVDLTIQIEPRFDYGEVRPWILRAGKEAFAAIGGDDALVFDGDLTFALVGSHDLRASSHLTAGERARLSIRYLMPSAVERSEPVDPQTIDRGLERTIRWWRTWSRRCRVRGPDAEAVRRSALVLKSLTYEPTGAIVAAPTTSLPEAIGAGRNWDYRYSWIRDSTFTVRALAEVGYEAEADALRRFVERSAAGSAEDIRIVYGVGGERRLPESTLNDLDGYRGSRPVRIGNAAAEQRQLDVFGHVLDLAYRWHLRGHSPDDDYWRFLVDLVDVACERWSNPDQGIWELRGEPEHYVHSKAMAWVAIDRGRRLAKECMRRGPARRWRLAADACRAAIERHGYDRTRGVFVRTFDSETMDAALLLLPMFGFVEHRDERMVRTVDAIRAELEQDGLLRRYLADDGLEGQESSFVACTFWLAECLARQGRAAEARDAFDRAVATANDLGLLGEQYDARTGETLGNFPQGLSHLALISAAAAIGRRP